MEYTSIGLAIMQGSKLYFLRFCDAVKEIRILK